MNKNTRIKEIKANIKALLQSDEYYDLDCKNCTKECNACHWSKRRNWFFEELERQCPISAEEKVWVRTVLL